MFPSFYKNGKEYLVWPLLALLASSSCSNKSTPAQTTIDSTPLPVSDIKYQLNDTGITYGGDYPLGVNKTCTGLIDPEHVWAKKDVFNQLTYKGQDCESGRDTEFSDNSDGFAGFSYQKISASGVPLAANASEWSCVLDRVTGLMWETKTKGNDVKGDGGLHDADDVFSWYSNDWDKNGGAIGNWGRDNELCSGYNISDTGSYCNTESYVARVNKSTLCSFSNWRMPTVDELSSLINFGATEPALDTHFFPNVQNAPYWTSSLIANSNQQARYVNFRFGQIIWSVREEPFRVKLVRDLQ